MAESVKVDADAFKAAIRALLSAPPEKMAQIPRKREPKLTDQMPRNDDHLGSKKKKQRSTYPPGPRGESLKKRD